jgi:histidinol-phosphate phosphatase family protein
MSGRRALFLDWGGTLVRAEDHRTVVNAEGNPVLMPRVAVTLARERPGYDCCFIVSNQARVGRGEITEAEVVRRFGWANERLGGPFTDWRLCPHGDDDRCACRKPQPRMFSELAAQHGIDLARSTHVGDSAKDRRGHRRRDHHVRVGRRLIRLGALMVSAVLALHMAAGFAGLVLGPVAMAAPKRTGAHTRAGEGYHWVVLAVCLTAASLAALDWPRLWWFLPIAAGSYAFTLLGYVAAKRRWRGWLLTHVSGQGGSYIALVTAVLVVNWSALTGTPGRASPWPWLLPTVVGTPLITWINVQVRRGYRPRL